ncbi:kinase-like protein [Lichtheimia hyalospora FSU 10163]|nr:kinase-like protein [Lichtheimia hyalospora FSU 10163]
MPYCNGGSLQQYVFDHHLTVGQLVYIIQAIASGLAEVHGHGYIHRDIKCDNIFLMQETNEIVIGDFGVVSVSPTADSDVEEAGVVLFWAPELVQRKIINRKIDIWALGIVILEILNGGKAPYEDDNLTEEEIKDCILNKGTPTYPPNLPSLLVNLLDRCLDVNPKSRISAEDILKHEFLHQYQAEPLFPATPIEQNTVSTLGDNIGVSASETIAMQAALEKLHDLDSSLNEQNVTAVDTKEDKNTVSMKTLAASSNSNNQSSSSSSTRRQRKRLPGVSDIRRCRIPLRAFTLTEETDGSATAQEKVLRVLRKRQSISNACWGQGSKLPMFKNITPPPSPSPPNKKDSLQRNKSPATQSRLSQEQQSTTTTTTATRSKKLMRKPSLVRSNTTPAASLAFKKSSPTQQEQSVPERKYASLPRKPAPKQATTTKTGSLPRPKVIRQQSTPMIDGQSSSPTTSRIHRFGYQPSLTEKKRPVSMGARNRLSSSNTGKKLHSDQQPPSQLKPPSPITIKTAESNASDTVHHSNNSSNTSDSNFKNVKVVRVR